METWPTGLNSAIPDQRGLTGRKTENLFELPTIHHSQVPVSTWDFSPHLCVGFLFLILYPASYASPASAICHTPSFTHNFVTHHLSHTIFVTHHLCHTHNLSHTTLSHTIFHTPLCHTPSFTHNFVTHHLSHTIFVTHNLSHTTLSHTIFHTPSTSSFTHQLCHTPSFTPILSHTIVHTPTLSHNFVTHHLSHQFFLTHTHHLSHANFVTHHLSHTISLTQLCHPPSFTHRLCHTSSFAHHLCHTPSFTHHLTHTTLSRSIFHTPFLSQLCGRHGTCRRHFAWQAWRLATSTFVLRFVTHTHHLSHTISVTQLCHAASFTHQLCHNFAAGVALGGATLRSRRGTWRRHFAWQTWPLGDIHLLFAWQAWHLGRWAGSGGALGRALVAWGVASLCVAGRGTWQHPPGVALGDILLGFAWQGCLSVASCKRAMLGLVGLCAPSFFATPHLSHTTSSRTALHLLLDPPPPPLSFLLSPSPLQYLLLIIGRSWLVGLSGHLIVTF